MPNFTCLGRDGNSRTFDYQLSTNSLSPNTYIFRVKTVPPPASGDFFELGVEKINSNTVQVIMAHHHNHASYCAMGIPEALLPIVKRVLNMNVESSPEKSNHQNVYRTDAATKYWQRLEKVGGAIYDSTRDVYSVIGYVKNNAADHCCDSIT